jgi:uncharacterized protein with HEPN domain
LSRSWQLFLRDMVEAAQKVSRYTSGRDLASFTGDEMAYDATVRNLEILGEAAKNIPEEIRQRYPEIDWRGIAGLRDVVAHAYFALDDTTLWKIVRTDMPRLLTSLNEVSLEALPESTGQHDEPIQHRDLSDIAGTWVEDPEVDEALADQRRIDPEC